MIIHNMEKKDLKAGITTTKENPMINLKEKEKQSESSNENVIISNSENNLVIDHAPIQNEELIDNIQLSFNKLLIKYKDNKIIFHIGRIIYLLYKKQNVSYNLSNNNEKSLKNLFLIYFNNYVQYYYIKITFIQYLCYE